MKKIILILLILSSCVTKEVPVEKIYGIITKVEIVRPHEGKHSRTPYTLYTVTFGQDTKEFKVWFEQYDKKVGDEWLYYKPLK